MKTVDVQFSKLCDEIDYWKSKAEYFEGEFEKERQINIDNLNRGIANGKKEMTNVLMLALSVSDDNDGNLVIKKKNRKQLAKNWN